MKKEFEKERKEMRDGWEKRIVRVEERLGELEKSARSK